MGPEARAHVLQATGASAVASQRLTQAANGTTTATSSWARCPFSAVEDVRAGNILLRQILPFVSVVRRAFSAATLRNLMWIRLFQSLMLLD